MKRRLPIVLAALAGIGAIALAGVVLAGDSSPDPPADTRAGGAAAGRLAPRLAGVDPVSGEPVSLARFRRKPVVVHVWASWCAACAKEADALRRFALAHEEAGVLGIDTQDTEEDAEAFYRRFAWTHPSIFDPDGKLAARLDVQGLPTTLFLTRERQVVARIVGPADFAELERGLARAKAQ